MISESISVEFQLCVTFCQILVLSTVYLIANLFCICLRLFCLEDTCEISCSIERCIKHELECPEMKLLFIAEFKTIETMEKENFSSRVFF